MHIKKILFLAILSISAAFSSVASAQSMTEGVVRRIDLENNKITIRHGEIKALDMPPMTMVFVAKQPALLKKLSPGDEVSFEAFELDGKLSVGKIEKK